MCPYLVLVALVVEAARLPADRAVGFMSMAMLGIAIYTLLQAMRRGPVGSGYLCPPVVSAIYLSACLVAAAKGGMPLVAGMILVAGLAECGLARIVGKLRKIFPAVVSGIILMAVGLDLARIGGPSVFAGDGRFFGPVQGIGLFEPEFIRLAEGALVHGVELGGVEVGALDDVGRGREGLAGLLEGMGGDGWAAHA